MDGVWNDPPQLEVIQACNILCESRFSSNGRKAVFGIVGKWPRNPELEELTFLGVTSLDDNEKFLSENTMKAGAGSRFAELEYANSAVEGEWRWDHDHPAYVSEVEEYRANDLPLRISSR